MKEQFQVVLLLIISNKLINKSTILIGASCEGTVSGRFTADTLSKLKLLRLISNTKIAKAGTVTESGRRAVTNWEYLDKNKKP